MTQVVTARTLGRADGVIGKDIRLTLEIEDPIKLVKA